MSHKKIARYANAELRCTKCNKKDNDLQGVMIAHDKGRYVTYEDFEKLDTLCKKLMKDFSDISCENIMLRKAGDAMASALKDGGIIVSGYILADEWFKAKCLAAKEGKPTK